MMSHVDDTIVPLSGSTLKHYSIQLLPLKFWLITSHTRKHSSRKPTARLHSSDRPPGTYAPPPPRAHPPTRRTCSRACPLPHMHPPPHTYSHHHACTPPATQACPPPGQNDRHLWKWSNTGTLIPYGFAQYLTNSCPQWCTLVMLFLWFIRFLRSLSVMEIKRINSLLDQSPSGCSNDKNLVKGDW